MKIFKVLLSLCLLNALIPAFGMGSSSFVAPEDPYASPAESSPSKESIDWDIIPQDSGTFQYPLTPPIPVHEDAQVIRTTRDPWGRLVVITRPTPTSSTSDWTRKAREIERELEAYDRNRRLKRIDIKDEAELIRLGRAILEGRVTTQKKPKRR